MNKHGQTLILFVILIPILLGLAAFVIDVGFMVSKRVELKEVSKTIIESVWEDANEEKIRDLFVKNDIPVEHLEVQITEESIYLVNDYEIDSIFGSVIGIKHYQVSVDITGSMKDGKVVFE